MRLAEILQLADTPLRASLVGAIEVIDSVHRFPPTPPFPVVISNLRREQGAYGLISRPARAVKIEVSRHADFPKLTLIHEVGHFLDHLALNRLKREFASEHDPLFGPLISVWAASPEVAAAAKLLDRFGTSETKAKRAGLRYHLMAKELWARSYTQWIVTRSGDGLLGEQLRNVHETGWVFAGRFCTFQWGADTFKPIMEAVDNLMESAGLL